MIRELILALMILFVCGPVMWLAGLWSRNAADDELAPAALERKRWLRIWFPQLPGAMAASALIGWALTETPTVDEALHPLALGLALAVAAWWVRAAVRAARALLPPAAEPLAATFGLIRPVVRIGGPLARALDADSLAAVELHERAHARHRDPLRIWLAQLATDLQLPTRAAHDRFDRWMLALELARDDEARRDGADGAALANAIVTTARLQACSDWRAQCGIIGSGRAIEKRVARLLAPLPAATEPPSLVRVQLGFMLILLGDLAAGIVLGDDLVRAIPGVLP